MPILKIPDDFLKDGDGTYQITFKIEKGKFEILDKVTASEFKAEEESLEKEEKEEEKEKLENANKREIVEPLEQIEEDFVDFRNIKAKEKELEKIREEKKGKQNT